MKNLFVQKTMGHCTVLALANMFRMDLSHFMTDEYKGCDDAAEKRILASIDPDVGIAEVLSVRHSYNTPLPNDLIYTILSFNEPVLEGQDEFDIIPYLLAVRRVNTHEYWHSVVVLNKAGQLYYIDPYAEDIIKVDKENIFKQFLDCWTIKRLTIESKQGFARLSSKALGFDLQ